MSKTFNITTTLCTKLVLPEDTLAGMRDYISKKRLPAPFQSYLESLDDEAMLAAFIKYSTVSWFKGMLKEQASLDGSALTFATPHVVVEGKSK